MEKFVKSCALLIMGAFIWVVLSGFFPSFTSAVHKKVVFWQSSAIHLVNEQVTGNSGSTKNAKSENDAESAEITEDAAESADEANETLEKQYWIGATVSFIPAEILAHISEENLEEGKGVFLAQVLTGAPAEQAGLKPFDIVSKINGEPVLPEDVAEKVLSSKGEKMTFEVLRAGKVLSIEVTPGERPAEFQPREFVPGPNSEFFIRPIPETNGMEFDGEITLPEEVRNLMEQQKQQFREFRTAPFDRKGEKNEWKEEQNLNLQLNSSHSSRSATIQENGKKLHIDVTQDDKKPAQIVVEWNGETWKITSDGLDSLPEEIRGIVQKYVESGTIELQGGNLVTVPLPDPEEDAEAPADAETPSETDAEAPADAETPSETDAEAPAGAETPSETDAEAPADAETPSETDAEAPAGAETPSETDAEAPADAETPSETDAEAPADAPKAADEKTEDGSGNDGKVKKAQTKNEIRIHTQDVINLK